MWQCLREFYGISGMSVNSFNCTVHIIQSHQSGVRDLQNVFVNVACPPSITHWVVQTEVNTGISPRSSLIAPTGFTVAHLAHGTVRGQT